MRVLSGIQPSGKLHIGNYFGAMRQHLELQNENEGYYFIADFHALTSNPDPNQLRENTLDVALDYLALGLNPEKTVFWRQSDVPQVTELAWILSCITPMGLLHRCVSYKDKISQGLSPNHGLFAYPVLQAADILIFNSEVVPVGADQKQHIEVTRDIAITFNNRYGEILTVPREHILSSVAVVPGIDGRKMSKSYDNTIGIFEEPSQIKKKIMRILTDSTPVDEPKDPDKCNIYALLKLFADEQEINQWYDKYTKAQCGYGDAKKRLLELVMDCFAPFRDKRKELAANKDYVEQVLRDGAARASKTAEQTLLKVKKAVGLI